MAFILLKIKIVGHYVNTTVDHYDNVFVHEGGKLEKRQFLAKMRQISPNCASNFKIFPGVIPPDTLPWGGGHHLPIPLPHSALRASTRGLRPFDGPHLQFSFQITAERGKIR